MRAALFVGALYAREDRYAEARGLLVERFGPPLEETPPVPWSHTRHYEAELGAPIMRRFVFFQNLVEKELLADIKHETIGMEGALRSGGLRTVNLDPGYLTPAKVVLASTKNYSHRLYLGRGIFAEVTLYAMRGEFRPNVFTYPDFRLDETRALFWRLRGLSDISENSRAMGPVDGIY